MAEFKKPFLTYKHYDRVQLGRNLLKRLKDSNKRKDVRIKQQDVIYKKHDYFKLLIRQRKPRISKNSVWSEVRERIKSDPQFIAVEEESDREKYFDEYIHELQLSDSDEDEAKQEEGVEGKRKRLEEPSAMLKVSPRMEEMEHNKLQISVTWMDSHMKHKELIVGYPEKDASVGSLLEEVKKQVVQLPEGGTGKLRFLLVNSCRIMDIIPNEQPFEELNREFPNWEYRVEQIPTDQLVVDQRTEYLLPVAHFHQNYSQSFGTPFLLKVKHDEPFACVKARVRKLLHVSDEDFEKYKFALCTPSKCSYIDNDNFPINLNDMSIGGSQILLADRPWLGLEHDEESETQ